ncbi:MAG: hypothetical protein JEZ07_12365 [Phycisphaerae bacterium]|nr:hypothetical protein [Phycisphaerae bacterium]
MDFLLRRIFFSLGYLFVNMLPFVIFNIVLGAFGMAYDSNKWLKRGVELYMGCALLGSGVLTYQGVWNEKGFWGAYKEVYEMIVVTFKLIFTQEGK